MRLNLGPEKIFQEDLPEDHSVEVNETQRCGMVPDSMGLLGSLCHQRRVLAAVVAVADSEIGGGCERWSLMNLMETQDAVRSCWAETSENGENKTAKFGGKFIISSCSFQTQEVIKLTSFDMSASGLKSTVVLTEANFMERNCTQQKNCH